MHNASTATPVQHVDNPLMALLLNTQTKGEEEDFLDYAFPAEDEALECIVGMKGIFLASCGVMRAAAGQEVSFFVFWSADRKSQYKVAIQHVEFWELCVVLPGDTSDGVCRFFVENAVRLVQVRHGTFETVKGTFGQLDSVFRALSSVWRTLRQNLEDGVCTTSSSALSCFALFNAAPWSSYSWTWRAEVSNRLIDWERNFKLRSHGKSFASLEGFALFMDHIVVGTSLDDDWFDVCLLLCLLEADGSPTSTTDVSCRSIFLQAPSGRNHKSPALLPTHQYTFLRHGQWSFLVLWRLRSGDTVTSPKNDGSADNSSPGDRDPFGTDVGIQLLRNLPLPEEYIAGVAAGVAKAMSSMTPTRSGSGSTPSGGSRIMKRSFSMPCPSVFKPLMSRSSNNFARGGPEPIWNRNTRFAHVLDLEMDPTCEAYDHDLQGLGGRQILCRPLHGGSSRWPGNLRPRCPESLSRVEIGLFTDWMVADMSAILFPEWQELDWLAKDYSRRRQSWKACPSPSVTRHPLVNVFKGTQSLFKVWNNCVEECPGEAMIWPGRQRVARPDGPVLLGSGEPWRFKANAPFEHADLSPFLGAGTMRCLPCDGKHWAAISAMSDTNSDKPIHRVLIHIGQGMQENVAAFSRTPTSAPSPNSRPMRIPKAKVPSFG